MSIVGLDLGLNTGVVALDNEGVLARACLIDVSNIKVPGARYCEYEQQLQKIIDETSPTHIGYEKIRSHVGTQAAHVYGALEGIMLTVAFESGITLVPLEVKVIKKFATGSGSATKEDMIRAARQAHAHDSSLRSHHTPTAAHGLSGVNTTDVLWLAPIAPYRGVSSKRSPVDMENALSDNNIADAFWVAKLTRDMVK